MLEKREASYSEMSSDTLRNVSVFSQSHVDASSLDIWSKCFISGKVYNSPCFSTFHVQANKRDVPSLVLYNITWFHINSIVPAARFVLHISTQDVETEQSGGGEQHETKALHTNDCGETNTPFCQSVWMNRGESDVQFPAQMMALMGFDLKCTGRISRGGCVCAFGVSVCR